MNVSIFEAAHVRKLSKAFCLLVALSLWVCSPASAQTATVTAELSKVISPQGIPEDMNVIPEGQSATLTVTIRPVPAEDVTVRFSLTQPEQVMLSTDSVVLSPGSTRASVIVDVINDDAPELEQLVNVVLRSEDENVAVRDESATLTFTIPQSYANALFCEALNTINCPAFFTLPDSQAPWRVTANNPDTENQPGNQVGPTVLRSGEIADGQRSCLSFITQEPTRIVFGWRVSSEEGWDVLFYIDNDGGNDRSQVADLTDVEAGGPTERFPSENKEDLEYKLATGLGIDEVSRWEDRQFDYSGSGPLMLEWCYAKDRIGDKQGEDAGFLDNLQVIPLGSVQARLFPQAVLESGAAELVLFYNVARDTTVKLAFADGTPPNVFINASRSAELKLERTAGRAAAALTVGDDDPSQPKQSGALTIALSPEDQAVTLSNTTLTFSLLKGIITAELSKVISPQGIPEDMNIIPEGQSATLTVTIRPASAEDVTVRFTLMKPDAPSVELSDDKVILGPRSTQASVIVDVINDGMPEPEQLVSIVLRSDDKSVGIPDASATLTFTIPRSYDNASFCEALNTVLDCPAFFTLPDSHAPWRVADRNPDVSNQHGYQVGPTVLRSGEIADGQRSCLGFITQQPAYLDFGWRVSSEAGWDLLFYIDNVYASDRSDLTEITGNRQGELDGGRRFLTGHFGDWQRGQFRYDGSGPLAVEWCYAKNGSDRAGEDAGFLDNLQVIPPGGSAPALGFDRPSVTVREGMESTFRIIAVPALVEAVTVTLSFQPGGTLNQNDDLELPMQIRLEKGQTSTTIRIVAQDDRMKEREEASTLIMEVQGFARTVRAPIPINGLP